jgi:hypothetical protein
VRVIRGDLEANAHKAGVMALQTTLVQALFATLERFDAFAAHASSSERSRMFGPVSQ